MTIGEKKADDKEEKEIKREYSWHPCMEVNSSNIYPIALDDSDIQILKTYVRPRSPKATIITHTPTGPRSICRQTEESGTRYQGGPKTYQ